MTIKATHNLPALSTRLEIFIIFLASLCHINSYNGQFVFDDSPAIEKNLDVTSTQLLKVFKNDFWGNKLTHQQSHRSYRPLTILTFRFHHWSRGYLNPIDFHIINLILHTIVCLLTYLIFKILFRKNVKHLAFYAATLFAVHPIHCEAVAGIVGRADVLCTMFVWLSIIFYNQSVHIQNLLLMNLNLLVCIICIAAAMLCKETGITAISICIAYELIINFYRITMMSFTGIVLMAIRFSLMGFSTPTFQPVDNPASFLDNIFLRHINYNYIYSLNTWLLICPEWLCFDWSMGCVPLIINIDPRIFAIFLTWAFIIGILKFIWTERKCDDSRYVFMGLCILLIPFLPASNIFFNVGFVLAERTLYFPSAGYCLMIIIGLQKLCLKFPSSKIPLTMYIFLIVIWFARSWIRSTQWQTEYSLYQSALNVCPLNAKVHYNVAKNAADMGQISLADAEYREALRLHPEYAQAMNNLGNLLKDQEKYFEAEKLLRKAVTLQIDFAAAWMNLGIVLSAIRKFNESEECYRTSLFYRSNCPDCYYNLGILYMEQKQFSEALAAWTKSISLKITHRRAWANLIRLLDDLGMSGKALKKGKEAIKLFPDDAGIRLNIANILGKLGNFKEAEIEFKTAMNIDPQNPSIYTNLGVLYHRWAKFDEAKKMYNKALEINPNAQSAKENLKKLFKLLNKQKT